MNEPDPLSERMSRLTPDPGRLDRDAILFAAGQASMPRTGRWKVAVVLLLLSHLLTIVLLWPRPAEQPPLPPQIVTPEWISPEITETAGTLGWHHQWISRDVSEWPVAEGSPVTHEEPPLRVRGNWID